MTVSVALCTYNGERWLPELLDSLAAQHRRPDEVVVSDDGSTDGTVGLVETFAARVPFAVRLDRTPRRLGSTMNFGRAFAACIGTLIAPADQDDVWAPDKLGHLEAVMEADGLALAFSDGHVVDERGARQPTTLWEGVGFGRRERRRFERDPLEVLVRRSVVTGAAMMFRADARERVLPLPEVLDAPASPMLQDRWIALVLSAVAEVGAVDEPLISFRRHPAQQTGLRSPTTLRTVGGELQRPVVSVAESFRVRADQLDAVLSRVGAEGRPGRVAHLQGAVTHLRARAGLPTRRARRLPAVAAEAVRGDYHRYTGGLASAVADLARPRG